MSGPKSSSYTLSYEQRRRLEEEQRRRREQEEERKRVEMESQKMRLNVRKLSEAIDKTTVQIRRLEELEHESGHSVPYLTDAKETVSTMQQQMERLSGKCSSSSTVLKNENEQLCSMIHSITRCFTMCAEGIKIETERYRVELDSIIDSGFHLSFSGLGTRKKEDNAEINRINEALAEISDLNLSYSLQEHLSSIRGKANEITDSSFLKNFYSVVVNPFLKECREYAAIQSEHDELLIHYVTLAAECGVSPRPVPYTREGIEFLKDEISILEQQIAEQREKEYIKAALDEAMREMGYELVGDRVVHKKSGKRIRHELYSLEDGTAVDVTYSDNGQISMELGGIDRDDRQPDANESALLVEDMKSFCSDYEVLEKKLAERGVQTRRISIMPPSAEYAQIFNENDYNMHKSVSRYSTATKRRKADKVMRRDS